MGVNDVTPSAMRRDPIEIDTLNEYAISYGENLPNHSLAQMGRGKFVRQQVAGIPTFRTQQAIFRYAAWLLTMAELLPHEDGEHTFEQVLDAVRNA